MGLDIYLYTADQAKRNDAYNAAERAWYGEDIDGPSPYDQASEEERKAWREQHSYAYSETVRSEKHPGHLFNRRYLRSSYNSSGFNHAVPEMLATAKDAYPNERGSLYWIFEPMGREWDGDRGHLAADDLPLLAECRKRAVEVVEGLKGCDRLRVMTVSPNMFTTPPQHSDADALRMYREFIAEHAIKADSWMSNRDMDTYGTGIEILAAVPGKATFDIPGVHLIYKGSDEAYDSYVSSAEVVIEFIDEATSLIKADGSCRMSWSG